jgi:hypothetical protein
MKRRLLAILAVLSLLLFLASVVMWTRSYRIAEILIYEPRQDGYSIFSFRGEVCFRLIRSTGGAIDHWRYSSHDMTRLGRWLPPESERRHLGGFLYETGIIPNGNFLQIGGPQLLPYVAVAIPYWALVVLFAGFSLIVWLVRGRSRKAIPGLCSNCGYDLRASTDRCPECGTTIDLTRPDQNLP